MYQYKNNCYSTQEMAFKVIASDCSPVTNQGNALTCTPLIDGYTINQFDGVNTTSITVNPTLQECQIDIDQVVELNALALCVIVAGFAIIMLRRVVR
jgi:hypothetical protein